MLAALIGLPGACASAPDSGPVFSEADFSHLRFLEGRWQGIGPDGKAFFEQYAFPHHAEMRSTRFADASFGEPGDGSVVALEGGQVISTWGGFTWRASELAPGKACFVPVSAPSAFCWERVSDNAVHVTQRWTDEAGTPQSYVVPLRRLDRGTAADTGDR